ncbi:MAG: substrate-binding domain-containing protein [Halopseudomonas sp.]
MFLLWLPFTAVVQAHVGSPYITIERYGQLHPEQPALMQAFAQQVEAEVIPQTTHQPHTIKVAAVYPGIQQSDYWHRNMRAFQRRLERLGFSYQFDDYQFKPNTSLALQQQAINKALAQDPDYLILTLDDPRQKRLIEQLLAQKRPKIILLNITTPLKDWESHQPFFYAGFDHVEGTKKLTNAFFKLTANQENAIGLVYRRPGYVSRMRGGTFADLVHARGDKLSASFFTESDVATSRTATLRIIEQTPSLNMIFACSTDVALGAIQAVNDKGLKGKVLVNGWGGGDTELDAIQRGDMALTVMRMNDDSAIAMAEAIGNDLTGRQVPQIYSGRFVVVTQQHSAEQVQQFSNTAFRYSNP